MVSSHHVSSEGNEWNEMSMPTVNALRVCLIIIYLFIFSHVQSSLVRERWWGSSSSVTSRSEHARPPARSPAWIVPGRARQQRPPVFAAASPRPGGGRWFSGAPMAARTPRRWKLLWNVAALSARCNSTKFSRCFERGFVFFLFVLVVVSESPPLPFLSPTHPQGCRLRLCRVEVQHHHVIFLFYLQTGLVLHNLQAKMGQVCACVFYFVCFLKERKYIVKYK